MLHKKNVSVESYSSFIFLYFNRLKIDLLNFHSFIANISTKWNIWNAPRRFSSLTPYYPYLLKVIKFLVKISHFEILVMTDKSLFVYKLFLSLSISDFSLFFV